MTDIKKNELKLIKDEYTKSIGKLVNDYNSNMGDYISEEVDNHDVLIEDYNNNVVDAIDKLVELLAETSNTIKVSHYEKIEEAVHNIYSEVANIDSVFSEYKDYVKDSVEWTEDSISNIINDTDTMHELKDDITNLLELKDRKSTLEYEINYYSKLK